jgi:hypothetical protein
MAKFNSKSFEENLKKEAYKSFENQLAQRIRSKYPDISDFSVKFDPTNAKFIITGLTEEQIRKISEEQ